MKYYIIIITYIIWKFELFLTKLSSTYLLLSNWIINETNTNRLLVMAYNRNIKCYVL